MGKIGEKNWMKRTKDKVAEFWKLGFTGFTYIS